MQLDQDRRQALCGDVGDGRLASCSDGEASVGLAGEIVNREGAQGLNLKSRCAAALVWLSLWLGGGSVPYYNCQAPAGGVLGGPGVLSYMGARGAACARR